MTDVFFISARVEQNRGLLQRLGDLVDRVGLGCVKSGDTVAVKVHFGDAGTTRYVRPMFSRKVVDKIRKVGGKPFLTDTLTLYKGPRSSAPSHLEVAIRNGFGFAQVNAPIIIADGLNSRDAAEVSVGLKHFDTVKIGSAVHEADSLVVLSHFKGHLAAGFGGTIKNLSMGLGTRAQKQRMHASVKPELTEERCIGCGDCEQICPSDAIAVESGVAVFDEQACVGCAECITTCTEGALAILWNEGTEGMQEKMAEVALGALKPKAGKALFFNFLIEITPDCDCFPFSDTPIVQDIGILASTDPVAIEQASVDLVNAEPGLPGSKLPPGLDAGEDKIRALYPAIDWSRQLEYAEQIGLGSRSYELVRI